MADLCHRNPVVYDAIMAHANMLITEIGFDGFRFDFVKGYGAWMIRSIHERQYVRGRRLVFPFGVGESWSSDSEIDVWLDEINRFSDNPISAFDFPLRYRLKDLCDGYGYSLRRLAEGGTVAAERPDRAVTFVDNHDFRGGDTPPIVNDKLMAYAFILTHPGYPCVFWQDYFERGLGRAGAPDGIAALVGARALRRRRSLHHGAHRLAVGGGAGVRAQQPGRRLERHDRRDLAREHGVPSCRLVGPRRRRAGADEHRRRRPRPVLGPPARLRRLRPGLGESVW